MEFRSIANLEELETLPDNGKILVIDAGTAKQISKTNAKFGGGGSITIFSADETGTNTNVLFKEDGSEVTPQEAFNALSSGFVEIVTYKDSYFFSPVCCWSWGDSNNEQNDTTDVAWVGIMIFTAKNNIMVFTIGDPPNLGPS